MNKKLVLIDGHSILNRAFYGVPDLTNAEGLHTNAVYGFLNILFKLLEEEQADYLSVAFDVKAPTFRHEIFADYKGTRKGMPEELREQVPIMKEVLQAMGVQIMEQPGLEADDILGTIAKRAEKEGIAVSLVSGDRDLLQVATDQIKIRIPKTKGGKTEIEDYYAADVVDKYQVTPLQFIDLKALMGDTADNIPGVPKVGEKTATSLMVEYGSIEAIYEHVEEITKKSIKESLKSNRELADLSKVLATINVDSPISYEIENMKLENLYTEDAYKLFKRLELKNLLKRFEMDAVVVNNQKEYFQFISSAEEANAIFEKAGQQNAVSFYVIEDHLKAKPKKIAVQMELFREIEEVDIAPYHDMVALSLGLSDTEIYVFIPNGEMDSAFLVEKLNLLKNVVDVITFDCKKQYKYLYVEQTDKIFDALIGAYLINPLKNDYTIADIANEYLGLFISDRATLFQKESLQSAILDKKEVFLEYAGFFAYVLLKSKVLIEEKLKEQDMLSLFRTIEMPLSLVLYEMEQEGIHVQKEELRVYGESLVARITELEQDIYQNAGVTFNINSPKQLGEILFEKLQLPGGKKTKTGYSTAVDVLEKLSGDHKIVADVLEYRGLAKLKSTYAEGLATCIKEDGKIHTTFNQTITATGRISSTEPNLQNIPMRTELGRSIRKVFVPSEGCVLADADYSQIELRLLAHISGDQELIEAYKMDADIHKITASKVFHTPFDEVTDLQRRNAKAVNFGIVYGISSFGLSQDLSITRKEADTYIKQYFETYPDVKKFLDFIVEDAKEKGYVTTLFGRRRPIPELSSSNFMQRSFGERVAMNSPIQGTAADIMKIAMIRVYDALKEKNLKAKLILQVHDELVIDTPLEEVEIVKEILTDEMKYAADLMVSLEVDLHVGNTWYEAK
ncbi:MAG: DNA polymerase I [Eubacteriales bacterium]